MENAKNDKHETKNVIQFDDDVFENTLRLSSKNVVGIQNMIYKIYNNKWSMYSKVKHINHLEANNSTQCVMLKSKEVVLFGVSIVGVWKQQKN